jgi:hypothetical protein
MQPKRGAQPMGAKRGAEGVGSLEWIFATPVEHTPAEFLTQLDAGFMTLM